MSKFAVLSLLILAVITSSCKEIDKLLTFEIANSQSIKFSTGLPLNNEIISLPIDVTTNSEEEFKNNDTRAEFVKDVTLKNLTLTITDPPAENFSFLKMYTFLFLCLMVATKCNWPIGKTLRLI